VPFATLAAALTVLVIAVTIIAPVVLVSQQLVRQLTDAVTLVQESLASGQWRDAIAQRPQLAGIVDWIEQSASLEDVPARLGETLKEWGPALVVGSLAAAVQLGITILVLFYFFRDKRDLAGDVRSVLPLSEREADRMIGRITETIHATIFGSLVVAAVQGFMGGLIFWALGLPAPILWGAVMAVLATIPVAGTFVVWAPTAAYLAMTGSFGKALVLVAWGAIAIGLIDNVLYPVLVGKRLRFHPLPVFFSIVGGLSLFGARPPTPRPDQAAVTPPSTGSATPVTNDASSDSRKSAAFAISSGRPVRPIGTEPCARFCTSSSGSMPAVDF
jgi:predicted PurR-regulated permease PerM